MIPRRSALFLPILCAAGCLVGPAYRRPSAPVPPAYQEPSPAGAAGAVTWKAAQPADAARRAPWWEVFRDSDLNALLEKVNVSNQTVALAEAQYRSARAAVVGIRSELFPTVGVVGQAAPSSGLTTRSPGPGQAAPSAASYEIAVDLGWEIDLFGRIRRGVEAGVAGALATAADLESVRLAMQAEAAVDYFLLRGQDAAIQLLQKTAAGYQSELGLTENRYRQGVASGIDVSQAKTQLESTLAQVADLEITRAQLDHALAVLSGRAPQEFTVAAGDLGAALPEIPAGLPSELLERRPDIAAAERRVAAANAQIGVAVAGFFPTLNLTGLAGYESSALAGLFTLPNRIWSLGASLADTIFGAGKHRAAYEQARAAYDGSVAQYRETVLEAMEQVEDNLAALRLLGEEARHQAVAVTEAERTVTLAKNRYLNGISSYFEVVTAQNTALSNERVAVGLLARQLTASVNLIKALGGGWRSSDQAASAASPATAVSAVRK